MAIADHFDHKPDVGFVRRYDARSARRQFQVSVALVVVLAMATLTLGLLLRPDKPFDTPQPASNTSNAAHVAETLPDIHG